jgi:hypothetical protein
MHRVRAHHRGSIPLAVVKSWARKRRGIQTKLIFLDILRVIWLTKLRSECDLCLMWRHDSPLRAAGHIAFYAHVAC